MGAATSKLRQILLVVVLMAISYIPDAAVGQQNSGAAVDISVYDVPEGVDAPPAVSLRLEDDDPCKASECDGTDPSATGCVNDAYTQWSVPIVVEGSPVGILALRGSHNICESTQWAEVQLNEDVESAARVRQCSTGLATEWRPLIPDDEGVARSAQLSSPDYCIWAEFAVVDSSGGGDWLIVAVTLPDSEPIA